jgi:hypothetical protein
MNRNEIEDSLQIMRLYDGCPEMDKDRLERCLARLLSVKAQQLQQLRRCCNAGKRKIRACQTKPVRR